MGQPVEGEPLLILLDELPPYFENARSKSIGNSDLSAVTGTTLANLFVAWGKPGLRLDGAKFSGIL